MKNNDTAFLDAKSGEGLENIGIENLQNARIKLLQQLSPELAHDASLKAGDFYSTETAKSLGTQLELIALKDVKVWDEYHPDLGGLKETHLPGSIPLDTSDYGSWKSLESGNTVIEKWHWLVILLNKGRLSDRLHTFTLTKSKMKAGKQWLSALSRARTPGGKLPPVWGCVWRLSSESVTGNKGTYYNISQNIELVRFVTQKEYEGAIKGLFEEAKAAVSDMKVMQLTGSQRGQKIEGPSAPEQMGGYPDVSNLAPEEDFIF